MVKWMELVFGIIIIREESKIEKESGSADGKENLPGDQ